MHLLRTFRPWLAGTALFLFAAARAENLSGTYENTGSQIAAATPAAGDTVSFQGLLDLNFDYALTRALHAETSQVVITQTDAIFRIECRDLDGKVAWSGQWERDAGYTPAEDRVDLVFHAARFQYDSFRFSLRPVPGKPLLLVEVQLVKATTLGPSVRPVGSFLFGQVSAGSPADRPFAGL